MFEFITISFIIISIAVIYFFIDRPREIKGVRKQTIVKKERVNAHTVIEISGYCATGDPSRVDQLFPAAKARLESTKSDDIIYLGVNPLTTGSSLSGMYIDLKELLAAVKLMTENQRHST